MMRTAPLLPLLFVSACAIGDAQVPDPADLSPEWLVDRLRVLAIRADPPEAAPGTEVRFEALLVDPFQESGVVVWLACPAEGDFDAGCPLDPSFDFTGATEQEREDAGFIGFEPLIPARYTPPESLFDGLTEFEKQDGVYVIVQIAALPSSVLTEPDNEAFDFNQVEVAYKRLVVSTASPNQNPIIASLSVDGVEPPTGAIVEVDYAQDYLLGARTEVGSDETYVYTNEDGVAEERHEEPYLKWYTDGGAIQRSTSIFGYYQTVWRSPPRGSPVTDGTWWVVARDRRGGIGWFAQPWRVRR